MDNQWITVENNWDEKFNWFLVDEGKIHFAFKNKVEAKLFRKQHFLSYMFLTNLRKISEIMVDPYQPRSWINKEEMCLYMKYPSK